MTKDINCHPKKYRPVKKLGKVLENPPYIYNPPMFGFKQKEFTGEGVSVGIVSTGSPKHKSIKRVKESESFLASDSDCIDINGTSTMIAGIMLSVNQKGVIGLSPGIDCYFAKVTNGLFDVDSGSLMASILWTLVKGADIIIVPGVICDDINLLHESFEKAKQAESLVLATDDRNLSLFTIYKEAVFVTSKYGSSFKIIRTGDNLVEVTLPKSNYATTYLDNTYAVPPKPLLAVSIVASLVALIMQSNSHNNKKMSPYSALHSLVSISKLSNKR